MKRITQTLLVLLTAMHVVAQSNENTVNAVIGDISFFELFHQSPASNTDETLRLQTHLSYVEKALASKQVAHLSIEQQINRTRILGLLSEYRTNNIFPRNYDYPERRPCFIDRDGNICAVGYLIEKTAGREIAEAINKDHQYDYLLGMNETVMSEWADKHGLTLEECAMIQPTYAGWPAPITETYEVPLKTSYGVSSGFATGINISMSIINLSNGFKSSKVLSYIGLATGATQVILGLTHIRKDEVEYRINTPERTLSYSSQNTVSYINITVGTSAMVTSAVNLLINNSLKDKRNAFNLYSYPGNNNRLVAGLSFTRSL